MINLIKSIFDVLTKDYLSDEQLKAIDRFFMILSDVIIFLLIIALVV